MSATEKRRGGGAPELGPWATPIVGGLYGAVWVPLYAGLRLSGDPVVVPDDNLIGLPIYAALGQVPLSTSALIWAAVIGALFIAVLIAAAVWLIGGRRPRRHIENAAPHLARGRHDLNRLLLATVTAAAIRLKVAGGVPGVYLGSTVAGRVELYADFESSEVDIWGPRTGKTSSRAIPTVLSHPGSPVVATTNRRDLVDGTRGVREETGTVSVFDPQGIIGETPSFHWNPLSYITSGPQNSSVKASGLAGIFAAATAPPDSKADRFFDPEGQNLLAHYMHAAARDRRPMTDVYLWLSNQKDKTPALILDREGFDLASKAVLATIGYPEEQRGGVFATAKLFVAWLTNPDVVAWITPGRGRERQFDPADFAQSTDTLYLVSREGRGSLAALTTALTAATLEAAEHRANRSRGGRLPVPLIAVLDEAANVCRWPDLPDLFSHYGGRGIYLLVLLQSWRQGEDVWGARGMSKMWSSAIVRVYGGGDTEVPFLGDLVKLSGTYRPQQVSSGHSRSGRSVNYSEGKDDVLSVADLSGLERGYALVIASGVPRPVLIRPTPWQRGPHREAVEASFRRYDPNAEETLADLELDVEDDVEPAGGAMARLRRGAA